MAYNFQHNDEDQAVENRQHQKQIYDKMDTCNDGNISPSRRTVSYEQDPFRISPTRRPPWLKDNERPPRLFGGDIDDGKDDNHVQICSGDETHDKIATITSKSTASEGKNSLYAKNDKKIKSLLPSNTIDPRVNTQSLRDWWKKWEHDENKKSPKKPQSDKDGDEMDPRSILEPNREVYDESTDDHRKKDAPESHSSFCETKMGESLRLPETSSESSEVEYTVDEDDADADDDRTGESNGESIRYSFGSGGLEIDAMNNISPTDVLVPSFRKSEYESSFAGGEVHGDDALWTEHSRHRTPVRLFFHGRNIPGGLESRGSSVASEKTELSTTSTATLVDNLQVSLKRAINGHHPLLQKF